MLSAARRQAKSIVLYDPTSEQLAARNTDQDGNIDHANCPYCNRPLQDNISPNTGEDSASSANAQAGFVQQGYFDKLRHRLPDWTDSAPPPSPRRRLVEAAGIRTESSARPPKGAEFVGSSPAPGSAHGISSRAFIPHYFQNFFVEEKELGRGGRGVVLLVKHVLDGVDCGQFACKRIPVGDDHEWLERVLVEVMTLQRLSHQNLVSYRHVWLQDFQINKFGPSVPCAFILQQYCNAGDLHNYVCGPATTTLKTDLKDRLRRRSKADMELPRIENEPRRLPFDEIYSFFKDITSGLRYLHANGFIHRDLKPNNCLLNRSGNELRVLVSDFGEVQDSTSIRKSTGATGTISYCAPEVLQRRRPDGPLGNFSLKSDIFSLGMILYFLCFASLPYQNADVLHEELEDLDRLRAEVRQWAGFDSEHKIRPELPEKLYSFLKRLLAVDPDQRPTADDVLNGIRTGSDLGENRHFWKRSPSTDELSEAHRIVPIDSPGPSTPSPPRSAARTTGVSRPRTSRLRHLSIQRRSTSPPLHASVEDETGSISPDRDLILRPKLPSPQRFNSDEPLDDLDDRRSPFLLPAPDRRSNFATQMVILMTAPLFVSIFRTLVVVGKVVSIFQPCASRGSNPSVFYPLLALAIWDYGFFEDRALLGLMSASVHVAVWAYNLHTKSLCINRSWAEE